MKIETFNPSKAINAQAHRKEKSFVEAFTVVDLSTGKTPIDLRLYKAGSTFYACVWGSNGDAFSGSAASKNGYTYSIQLAFRAAGIEITDFAGRSNNRIDDALTLVAQKMGLKKFVIINAHG